MNRHLANFLIFVLAVVLYATGFGFGAVVVIGLAVLLELTFWMRLIRGTPPRKERKENRVRP